MLYMVLHDTCSFLSMNQEVCNQYLHSILQLKILKICSLSVETWRFLFLTPRFLFHFMSNLCLLHLFFYFSVTVSWTEVWQNKSETIATVSHCAFQCICIHVSRCCTLILCVLGLLVCVWLIVLASLFSISVPQLHAEERASSPRQRREGLRGGRR